MLKNILQASAGTGKTHQIVTLGLEPAGGGNDFSCLRRTVFLSFSNAAAEEIKTRLYAKITPKTAATFREAVGTSEARVYTIHAFCFELARIFRYELGLPADARFPTKEDSSVWGDCVDDFFRSHWDLATLTAKLGYTPGTTQHELLKALHVLGKKLALRDFVTKHGQKIFFLGELMGVGTAMPAAAPAEDCEALAGELAIAKLLDIDEGNAGLAAALDKAVPVLIETRPVLEQIIAHIGRHVYIPYMYRRGVFDFDSLVYFVVKILKNMKAQEGMGSFLQRLDDEGFGFDRLFVDEAQDCDILMNNLIGYFLGDKCRVETTLVGDAKQSIYRWRNAYPEEFLKMCEEAESVGKRRSLRDSYRINNQNTLKLINGLVAKVKEQYVGELRYAGDEVRKESFFDYNAAVDELTKPEDTPAKQWMQSTTELKADYGIINDSLSAQKTYIEDFISQCKGRTGVIFRSRSHFRKSRLGIMLGDKLQYRLAEPFEEEKEYGENKSAFEPEEVSDIDPDYYLLKTLLWCFTAADREKAAATLLLTRKGLELAGGLWPEDINNAAVSTPAKFIEAAAKVYDKIQALYYGNTETAVTERIYSLLDEKTLWPVFFRPECLMSPERAARALNHALAGLYLHEHSGASHSGGEDLLASLGAAKIPYESCISYDIDQDTLTFAEAVTVHSSKGLTYDKVILILESNKMLKSAPDGHEGKEEFPYLFHSEFEKTLTAQQKVSINYFPYLGALPARHMRESSKRYSGIDVLYNETFKRVKAEKANLFYVGVTRTKQHLMFLDIGTPPGSLTASGKKSTAKPPMLQAIVASLQEAGKIIKGAVPVGIWSGQAAEARTLLERGRLDLSGKFRLVGVRTYIKDSSEITTAPRLSSGAAGLVPASSMNMYIGVRVHELVAELMRKAPGPEQYDEVINTSPVAVLDEPGRRAAQILLRQENKSALQPLFKPGIKNLPELRVWGLSEKGGQLLNGVVDGVLIDPLKINILEYKTTFGKSAAQTELGRKQKDVYIMLIGRLKNGQSVGGDVVEIKAG